MFCFAFECSEKSWVMYQGNVMVSVEGIDWQIDYGESKRANEDLDKQSWVWDPKNHLV